MTDQQPRYSAVYRFFICCRVKLKDGYYDIDICDHATARGLSEAIANFYQKRISPKGVPITRTGRMIIYEMSCSSPKHLHWRGRKVYHEPRPAFNKPYPEI